MPAEGTAQVVRNLPKFSDPNLLVGAEHFSDAGAYRLGPDLAIVQSVDFFPPLVDDPFLFGQIAAANAMSDVYACGAKPRTALNIVGFPDKELDLSILSRILEGGAERVQAAGAVILGGHSVRDSEIKYGLAVTGIVRPEELWTNAGAKPGDRLYLTKALGTGFVTTASKKDACPARLLELACQSMVTLNDRAAEAARQAGASAVTDVTGFGLLGHAVEMALASDVTIILHLEALPVFDGVVALVEGGYRNRAVQGNRQWAAQYAHWTCADDHPLFQLACDPQTSGGLLISLPAERAPRFEQLARQLGVPVVRCVGEVVERRHVAVEIQ